MTKRVTLARLRELLTYNPETGVFTWNAATGPLSAGSVAGTISNGWRRIKIDGRLYQAHVLAWFWVKGRWPRRMVDHEDTNRDNNRWGNLREANNSQNGANKPKLSTNTSGFKGVSFCNRRKLWRAQVQKDGRKHHIGYFGCPTAAAFKHDSAAIKLHGAFARVNIGVSPSGLRHRVLVPAYVAGSNPATPATPATAGAQA